MVKSRSASVMRMGLGPSEPTTTLGAAPLSSTQLPSTRLPSTILLGITSLSCPAQPLAARNSGPRRSPLEAPPTMRSAGLGICVSTVSPLCLPLTSRILLGSWNRLACTSRTPPRPTLSPSSLAPRRGPSKMTVWHCIALHRAVMRYKGFYDWMTGSGPSLRRLPSKNLFAVQHKAYADELLAELLPADRDRFRRYMSDRPLGIGIIAAAAGFGKTTVLATAGLSMEASLGSILVSGPTDVVVDNIARRLDRTSKEVCGRLNAGKTAGDRARHRMVVRGYNMRREVEAFINLWENPGYTPTGRKSKDPWQL